MEQKVVIRLKNLINSIAKGTRWQLDEDFRKILEEEVMVDDITIDTHGNLFYNSHFVANSIHWEETGLHKYRKIADTAFYRTMAKFYSQMILTLLKHKTIRIPDKELILCAGAKLLSDSNPKYVLKDYSEAIIRIYADKDEEELEKLPREIRKLIKFYYVPASTRRDPKKDK